MVGTAAVQQGGGEPAGPGNSGSGSFGDSSFAQTCGGGGGSGNSSDGGGGGGGGAALVSQSQLRGVEHLLVLEIAVAALPFLCAVLHMPNQPHAPPSAEVSGPLRPFWRPF
jgi:hypothetical protein